MLLFIRQNCFRSVSVSMQVKQLIVPSVKKLVVMWKERFGMRLLEKERLKDIEGRRISPCDLTCLRDSDHCYLNVCQLVL
jgi:hypothetical protein